MSLAYDLGKKTEYEAEVWLLKRGNYRVIARNYRCKAGELDLVLEGSEPNSHWVELIFVEVRARSAHAMVSAVESLSWKKRQRLRRAIGHFMMLYSGPAKRVRFDLLAKDGDHWTHLPNLSLDFF